MAVRSARLWTFQALDLFGSWTTVAEVPAGERWILKELAIRHSGEGTVVLFFRSSIADHFEALELPETVMTIRERWAILPEGSVIQVFAPAATDLRGSASGTRLVL